MFHVYHIQEVKFSDLEDVTPLTKNAKELVRLYRKDEDSLEGTEYQ